MKTYRCNFCGYKATKETQPDRCNYCSKKGGMVELENAEDLLKDL
jgi:rubrerythrin